MASLGTRDHFRYHPIIGHTFVPGLRTRVPHEGGGYLVRANAMGLRADREYTPEKAPGSYRVLLFGDSFTAGDGVSNARRYGDVLEASTPGLEVYNFGISGSGTDQQYLAYRELARGIDHDLVVVAIWIENIARIVASTMKFAAPTEAGYRLFARPYFTLQQDGSLALQQVPVPVDPIDPASLPAGATPYPSGAPDRGQLRDLVYRLGPRVSRLARRLTGSYPDWQYQRPDEPSWLLMRAILERWAAESRTPLLIVPLPLAQHIDEVASPAGYRARFAELQRPPAIAVHDPLPDLLRYPRATRRGFRFPVDVHPTAEGHRALAASLAPTIRRYMVAAGVSEPVAAR
jgi:carbamoyltransferase